MLTERSTGLIAEQLRAFEARRPHDAASNAEETARLANLYRHESLKMKAEPNALDDAPAEPQGAAGDGHPRLRRRARLPWPRQGWPPRPLSRA